MIGTKMPNDTNDIIRLSGESRIKCLESENANIYFVIFVPKLLEDCRILTFLEMI